MDILLSNKIERKAFLLTFQVCLLDWEMQGVTKKRALQFAEDRGFSERPTLFVLFNGIFIIFFQVSVGHFQKISLLTCLEWFIFSLKKKKKSEGKWEIGEFKHLF